tara:strand:- start:5158 stop:5283 length:126 start_codon:yes stop_codon:yes gene_type:complete
MLLLLFTAKMQAKFSSVKLRLNLAPTTSPKLTWQLKLLLYR